MSSCSSTGPSPSSVGGGTGAELRAFIREQRRWPSQQRSEQRIFPGEQAIVTSRLCAELLPQMGSVLAPSVKSWFRWTPRPGDSEAAKSSCSPGGAPWTPRGALTSMATGVHGAWREDALAGVSVPCAALQQRKLRLHDYCLPMLATFGHAPPESTYWWRGVALIGNELHTDNFHHFNRDALFFSRAR